MKGWFVFSAAQRLRSTSCCTGRFGLGTVFEKGAQKQRQSQAPVSRALYVLPKLWGSMKYQNKIEHENCSGMEDIRVEIDNMDRDIIAILGKRFEYVKAASKFKTSETSVRAPERFKAMLEQRRVWASSEGLSPDAIEKMYRDLVNHFINEEMSKWQSESTNV